MVSLMFNQLIRDNGSNFMHREGCLGQMHQVRSDGCNRTVQKEQGLVPLALELELILDDFSRSLSDEGGFLRSR